MWENGWRESICNEIEQEWDIVVVGGGITGAGVFRRAVAAGSAAWGGRRERPGHYGADHESVPQGLPPERRTVRYSGFGSGNHGQDLGRKGKRVSRYAGNQTCAPG